MVTNGDGKMNNNMKCPFCQQELVREGSNNYWCKKCNLERHSPALYGSQKLWQELIRTRKALDVALDGLEKMTWGCDSSDAELLLKEIKEILEQKDIK